MIGWLDGLMVGLLLNKVKAKAEEEKGGLDGQMVGLSNGSKKRRLNF